MSKEIKVIITGKPISKDNQKRGVGKYGQFFTRPEYRIYEETARLQAVAQLIGKKILKNEVEVEMIFYFPNKIRCDLFNVPKSVCDALNGVLWEDDKQIIAGHLFVRYDKKNPRVEIVARECLHEKKDT